MAYDSNNVFAKILRGEVPSVKVYEDDKTLAFMDVMPQADGHTLVIAVGGISILAAFIQRKRSGFFRLAATLAMAICVAAIMLTKSRGGQVAMMLVFFVYMVKRYHWKAFIPAAMMAVPLLRFGGRSDSSADPALGGVMPAEYTNPPAEYLSSRTSAAEPAM